MPEIEPGGPITVGPEGHFASIGDALSYARETFHPLSSSDVLTIRVSGGRTYEERIVIDNSQLRSFPQGVCLICEDAEPAVLHPPGTEPVIDLRTVERFHLKGFTIRGSGQPTLVRLEGYFVRTLLEKLSIEGAGETAVRGIGATGLSGGNRLVLQDLTIRDPLTASVAMQFRSGPTPTKSLLIRRCRVLKGFDAGISFAGGVSDVEVSECIFDTTATGIQFDASAAPWEDIIVSNCTFRAFRQGIRWGRSLTPSDGSFRLTQNLFAEGRGSECLISGRFETGAALPQRFSASYNWTQRPAPTEPQPGEVDLFVQDGRRGAGFTFVSIDPAQRSTYLQPDSAELRAASARVPQSPKHIGAVAPAAK